MRAKTAIAANTARKKEGCVAFANDDFENARRVKYYREIIADDLSKAGWSLDCVSAIDSKGERSGLWTLTAAIEGVLSFAPVKSSLRFWNWKGRFVSTY